MEDIKELLGKVAGGQTLSEPEAATAFDIIMSGDATPAQIGAFLMALRVRGETVDEITAAARIMRAKALHVAAPDFDDSALLPCLATGTPEPATTMAAAVEML